MCIGARTDSGWKVTTTKGLREILYGPEQPQGADEEWVADVYRQLWVAFVHMVCTR